MLTASFLASPTENWLVHLQAGPLIIQSCLSAALHPVHAPSTSLDTSISESLHQSRKKECFPGK